ncbi:phosphatase PAP2 family protein [Streptomyces smyrnaeus]|uniref:phosphatase PAP2 family protein n=1 Tax=Streptomyces smyrnaeus TaxID=1387713 RepID=UPI0033C9EA5B
MGAALRAALGRRPQPSRTGRPVDSAAMPSGHAMTTAATCVLLLRIAHIIHMPAGPVRLGAATAAVAAACFTQVFLGVHWLTDTRQAEPGPATAPGKGSWWGKRAVRCAKTRSSECSLSMRDSDSDIGLRCRFTLSASPSLSGRSPTCSPVHSPNAPPSTATFSTALAVVSWSLAAGSGTGRPRGGGARRNRTVAPAAANGPYLRSRAP